MSDTPARIAESRAHPRTRVPAMYTLLRARASGSERYRWTGHIYDISIAGMRFELDRPLEPGSEIEVRGMLPGNNHTTFRATGKIVRLIRDNENEVGPVRMGLVFDRFQHPADERRLQDYLQATMLKAA